MLTQPITVKNSYFCVEVNRRKSTTKAKLKATNPQERIKL